jgi:hypothetical protein
VESPIWGRLFEAEHDAHRHSIEAHLEGLEDDNVDYELQETYVVAEKMAIV